MTTPDTAPLRDEELLGSLFAQAPVGLAVFDAELRFVVVNEILAQINGVPLGEHHGRTIEQVLPGLASVARPLIAEVLASGEPAIDVLLTGETPARAGVQRTWSESVYPLRDESGTVVGVGAVVLEVTDRVRAERERKQALDALEDERTLLHGVIGRLPTGVALLMGPDLVPRVVNDAGLALAPLLVDDPIGRPLRDVLDPAAGAGIALFEAVLRTGEARAVDELPVALPDDPRSWRGHRFYRFSADPIRRAGGTVDGVLVVVVEVTADVRRRELLEADRDHLAFLALVSQSLDVTLGPDAVQAALVRLCVGRLATWATVTTLQGSRAHVVAAAHADPARADLERRFVDGYHPPSALPGGAVAVLQSGQPVLHRAMRTPPPATPGDEPWTMLADLGLRSAVLLPLTARGTTVGVLTLGRDDTMPAYEEGDVALAADLASRSALAIDNARLYAEQAHVARTLQRGLLPAALPEIAGIRLTSRYHAAGSGNEVGGDFYDVHAADEHSWTLTIGDVCGRGPEAASLTALMRHTLRAATSDQLPAQALARLNALMLQQAEAHGRFATAVTARLRPAADGTAELTWACAGHPPPVLVRPGGTALVLEACGPLLGVTPRVTYTQETRTLQPGEIVVLYTDGVLEADRHDVMDAEALALRLQEIGPDPARLTDAMHAWARRGQGGGVDDAATLVITVV